MERNIFFLCLEPILFNRFNNNFPDDYLFLVRKLVVFNPGKKQQTFIQPVHTLSSVSQIIY